MEHLDYMYPSPHFSDAKMARFSRFFIIALRVGGLLFLFILSKTVGSISTVLSNAVLRFSWEERGLSGRARAPFPNSG